MANFFPHAVHPYYDISLVMHIGSQSLGHAGVYGSQQHRNSSCHMQKRYVDGFDKMLAISPGYVGVMCEAYKDDKYWKALFRKAAGDARQLDTSGLKIQGTLPSLKPSARHLPSCQCFGIQIDARVAVEEGEDTSEAPLTPRATEALNILVNGCKLPRMSRCSEHHHLL
ncbi:hypothetical protein B0H12DRAFT_1231946 [Mycena haematopus]|nr:hypothetical protein B0H12DRAFT_1231946 [Mycena haematopus]